MAKKTRPGGLPDAATMNQIGGMRPPEGDAEGRVAFGGFSGPPVYGDQPAEERRQVHNEAELRQSYQQFEGEDAEADDEDDEDLDDWEDDDEEDDDVGEYPTPPSLRQPDGSMMRDQPLFPGGPLVSEINSWKKQFEIEGHTVHWSPDIGGQDFIWRTLGRTEYREIMNLPNTDPLQREEIICEICVLFPYEYSFATMASRKAGVPAVLAEHILGESGFRKPTPPQRL